jgi:hypothetical protein
MLENKIKNTKRIISLIDKRILRLISSSKEEIDEIISTLLDVRLTYQEELNKLIKLEQLNKMFDDKEYRKSYGKR